MRGDWQGAALQFLKFLSLRIISQEVIMAKEYELKTGFASYRIRLFRASYASNGNTAIRAKYFDKEQEDWDLYGVCTVNTSYILDKDCAAFKDYSEGESLYKLLLENKVICAEPDKYIHSGYCMLPVHKIDMDMLEEEN